MKQLLLIACIAILSVSMLGCKQKREVIQEAQLGQEFTIRSVTYVYQDDQSESSPIQNEHEMKPDSSTG